MLHRDRELLVLAKPSGLPTTSPTQARTLVQVARELDPRAPRLHPSSRLDAEVSGVVVFARTSRAIAQLLAARRAGRYSRGYFALAAGPPEPASGSWEAAIALDPRDPRRRVAAAEGSPGARAACTRYRTLARATGCAALWLEPQTGRTHQLRVHAAHAGVPLLGDRLYGGPRRSVLADGSVVALHRAALHCTRVRIPDPAGGAELCFEAPLPEDSARDLARAGRSRTGAAVRALFSDHRKTRRRQEVCASKRGASATEILNLNPFPSSSLPVSWPQAEAAKVASISACSRRASSSSSLPGPSLMRSMFRW